jgi:hypothetical protein
MLSWNEVQGSNRVKFRLMNRDFDFSITEWYNCFGFVNNDTHIYWANDLLSHSPLEHFHLMVLYNNVPKGGDIESPVIRYLYYVIANTLQARNEFTRVNEEDMVVLAKAAILECNMMPNLGAILLFYLDRQAVQTHGSIVFGGVATVLANALNVPLGNLRPLAGEHLLGLAEYPCRRALQRDNKKNYTNT